MDPYSQQDLTAFIAYRCVIGSQAYGLAGPGSDTDRRGFYVPPADLHWSLRGLPEQLEDEAAQSVYWEVGKFIRLALKANPNILECLYTPLVEHVSPQAQSLIEQREIFLSRQLYQSYSRYVESQFRRQQHQQSRQGRINWKHAMHLIRLLLSGLIALREGRIAVDVGEHREALLAIRRGEWEWARVDAWRLALHGEFEAAYTVTRLPDGPDFEQADRLLIALRRSAL